MEGANVGEIRSILDAAGIGVIQQVDIPPRAATYEQIPTKLHPVVSNWLRGQFKSGLYSHQAEGIRAVLEGNDLCLATSTASGKSMVFMAAAAHFCLSERGSKVMALYPAKALIQDQLAKWREFFAAIDLQVGFIDGSVPTSQRSSVLESSDVVLLTPDVTHAWLMSRLHEAAIQSFMKNLRLLVLDEAHVYEGVFGTNMAYFLRRLTSAAAGFQTITSTATLTGQAEFVEKLTGSAATVIDESEEGAPRPEKHVLLVGDTDFSQLVSLLDALLRGQPGRLLAFADSRKMVERLVAAARRVGTVEAEPSENEELDEQIEVPGVYGIYPYRAGYENKDRNDIQEALTKGTLRGVVATGALELGLDIGDIDLVVLLSAPHSIKALRQRLGRAGRKRPAVCIVVDSRGTLSRQPDGLATYLAKPAEANWLYLDNRFIQFANALCAAQELGSTGKGVVDLAPFETLPIAFLGMLSNELEPKESVPDDLYPLKQRAMGGAHREFMLRSDLEKNFDIRGSHKSEMGEITLSQALREAYPGAVYYYMARPYRVYAFKYRDGEILLKREGFITTEPISRTTVFPKFQSSYLFMKGPDGFLAETPLQVSEKVSGFRELRGSKSETYTYGVGSPWYQNDLPRFFPTTGVCWASSKPQAASIATAEVLKEIFCSEFGVHPRELGVGAFFAQVSPVGTGECRGVCVYDAAHGSLRLTERLAEHFAEVVDTAISDPAVMEDPALTASLADLAAFVASLEQQVMLQEATTDTDGDWRVVIAPGQQAMCGVGGASKEVTVLGHRYTPQGLVYDLKPTDPLITRHQAPSTSVQPMHGFTRMIRVNLVTGEIEEL